MVENTSSRRELLALAAAGAPVVALGSRWTPPAWGQSPSPIVKPLPPEWFIHELLARATDREGLVQPDTVPFNDNGYQFWAVVRHPVRVT